MSAPEHNGTVVRQVQALIEEPDGNGTPVYVDLSYRVDDPWAVLFTFWCGDDPRDWVFARDLLRTGMMCASGEGDVTIAPHAFDAYTTIIEFTVRYPDRPVEHAVCHFNVADLSGFLWDTEELVRVGDEASKGDFDAEFARFAGAWE